MASKKYHMNPVGGGPHQTYSGVETYLSGEAVGEGPVLGLWDGSNRGVPDRTPSEPERMGEGTPVSGCPSDRGGV